MFKIAITGPESTGKSTLAEKLAKHFNTDYIPEYSRTYLENFEGQYTENDVVEIAKAQHNLIIEEEKKNPYLAYDDFGVGDEYLWIFLLFFDD